MIGHLLTAIHTILAPTVLLYLLLGIVLGIIVGALPGLTATMAMIVLLPITFGLPVLESIQLLMGVFVGGITAGSLTAIAIGIPGTPASAATVLDGYPLTLAGRAGEATLSRHLAGPVVLTEQIAPGRIPALEGGRAATAMAAGSALAAAV